jgi:multidrug resistance protein, MATE family
MGLHAQRAILILTLASFPVALIWSQTDPILRHALAIDPAVAAAAGRWSTLAIAGLWPTVMFEVLRKFLQAQKLLWPIVAASSVATAVHCLNNWLLVGVLGLGFDGAAIAAVLTQVPPPPLPPLSMAAIAAALTQAPRPSNATCGREIDG